MPAGRRGGYNERDMDTLTLTRPDDWHLHLRDGDRLRDAVGHTARVFARAIVMPNLRPPITDAAAAEAYRSRILEAADGLPFEPLMTLYLTPKTTPAIVDEAARSGFVKAIKLYPSGATTNSDAGVSSLDACDPVFEAMQRHGMPLLIHGETTHPDHDIFDREARFVRDVLAPLVDRFPELPIVLEHVTTRVGVDFVREARDGVGATITPQHLLWNRNAIFKGGLRPHAYCLPVLKREHDREALVAAATSGSSRFFLGTDSAPHPRNDKHRDCACAGVFSAASALELYAEAFDRVGALDKLEAFASVHGPAFYGLPQNSDTVTLRRAPLQIPNAYPFGDDVVVPMSAGETLAWSVSDGARA
jgi:dihydroorotase